MKFFILMNHTLTDEQIKQAKETFGVSEFINISDTKWSDIDPAKSSILDEVQAYKDALSLQAKKGDILLVQGDFGATYHMVRFAESIGLKAIYATTKRIVKEEMIDGKLITKREFRHERFRKYECV